MEQSESTAPTGAATVVNGPLQFYRSPPFLPLFSGIELKKLTCPRVASPPARTLPR